eukprot:1459708-Pleurochrysis_carterae.AAC.2
MRPRQLHVPSEMTSTIGPGRSDAEAQASSWESHACPSPDESSGILWHWAYHSVPRGSDNGECGMELRVCLKPCCCDPYGAVTALGLPLSRLERWARPCRAVVRAFNALPPASLAHGLYPKDTSRFIHNTASHAWTHGPAVLYKLIHTQLRSLVLVSYFPSSASAPIHRRVGDIASPRAVYNSTATSSTRPRQRARVAAARVLGATGASGCAHSGFRVKELRVHSGVGVRPASALQGALSG